MPLEAGGRGAVEDPLHRGSERGEEGPAQDLAVVDHVDVQDGRVGQFEQPSRVVQRPVGQQPVGVALRHREDDGVRGEAFAVGPDRPAAVLGAREGVDAGTQVDLHARRFECLAGEGVVEVPERHGRPADVGGARFREEPRPEDLRGERRRGVRRGGVERGDTDEVPEGLDGALRLPLTAQPGGEVDAVERGVGRIEAAQCQRGAGDAGLLRE